MHSCRWCFASQQLAVAGYRPAWLTCLPCCAGSALLGAWHQSCCSSGAAPGELSSFSAAPCSDCIARWPDTCSFHHADCAACEARITILSPLQLLPPCHHVSNPDCNFAQELDILLEEAAKSGVQPVIGLRAKLATRHGGHWGTTSGENAKFGLSPRDIVAVVRKLAAMGMADCLQLLHFHIGSQVPLPWKRHPICMRGARELLLSSVLTQCACPIIVCRDTYMACRRRNDDDRN